VIDDLVRTILAGEPRHVGTGLVGVLMVYAARSPTMGTADIAYQIWGTQRPPGGLHGERRHDKLGTHHTGAAIPRRSSAITPGII